MTAVATAGVQTVVPSCCFLYILKHFETGPVQASRAEGRASKGVQGWTKPHALHTCLICMMAGFAPEGAQMVCMGVGGKIMSHRQAILLLCMLGCHNHRVGMCWQWPRASAAFMQ